MKKIAIIGGGISGLASAYFLRQKYPDAFIELYEASDRLGGWMQTKEVSGFSFELGPRTFQRSRCPLLLDLSLSMGVEVDFAPSGTRYLWHQGRLRPMQSFWPQLLWAMVHDLFSRRGTKHDETIYEFATRRCGRRAAELFFDPLAKGVFGGDIRKLSAKACFPSLFTSKSFLSMMWGKKKDAGLFTVRGGMSQLVQALANIPDKVHLNAAVEQMDAEFTVVALPAEKAAFLCGVPLEVRNETMHVVNIGFKGDVLPKSGYGYLIPTAEAETVLGQIWDSSIFPVSGQTKVTTMVRGDEPVSLALSAMKRHLMVDVPFEAVAVTHAHIPQYDLYHNEKIAAFESEVKRKFEGKVALVGNYLEGASVEACLARAKQVYFSK